MPIVSIKDRLVCNLCNYEVNNRRGMLLHSKYSHPDSKLENPKDPACSFKCTLCKQIYSEKERVSHHKNCRFRFKC